MTSDLAAGGLDAPSRLGGRLLVLVLISICFVPVWAGLTLKVYFPPAALSCLVVVAGGLSRQLLKVNGTDLAVFAAGLVAVLAALAGVSAVTPLFTCVVVWGGAYVAGRVIGEQVQRDVVAKFISLAFATVAVLALYEARTSSNFFSNIVTHNQLYRGWSPLQVRGGRLRVEGAFGHSIALGASLAAAIPFIIAWHTRLRNKLFVLILVLTAAAFTYSRSGMLCAVLSVLLAVLRTDSLDRSARRAVLTCVTLAGCLLLPSVSSALGAAGQEAAGSADYRGTLLELIRQIPFLGLSSSRVQAPSGFVSFGPYRSIDNALLLSGLTYGWLFLVPVVVLLFIAVIVVLRGRGHVAQVALVAQIPALATVAFITQYASWFWFVAGLAATALQSSKVPGRLLPERLPMAAVERFD